MFPLCPHVGHVINSMEHYFECEETLLMLHIITKWKLKKCNYYAKFPPPYCSILARTLVPIAIKLSMKKGGNKQFIKFKI